MMARAAVGRTEVALSKSFQEYPGCTGEQHLHNKDARWRIAGEQWGWYENCYVAKAGDEIRGGRKSCRLHKVCSLALTRHQSESRHAAGSHECFRTTR